MIWVKDWNEDSVTEGFSPILYCRPDVVTLGSPVDTMTEKVLYLANVPT